MPAHLEILGPGGGTRTVPVWHGTFVLGADPAADVRVDAPGLRPQHLRFVPTDGMIRVEPVVAGATVDVNGEQLFCKDLRDGDVITIGTVRIRWVDPQPVRTAPARPRAPTPPVAKAGPAAPATPTARPRGDSRERPVSRGPRAERPRAAPARPRRDGGSWAIVGTVVVVVVLVGYGVVQRFGQSTWPASPQHFVDLAREQLANHHPEAAQRTLAFAMKDATGPVRAQAEQLEAEIRRLLLETAAQPKVATARFEHDALQAFVRGYLQGAVTRPAAREAVLRSDRWLASHRDVCANHGDGKELLRAVEEIRARYAPSAQLDTAETAADVLFVVQERLAVRWRDYKVALARIDAFLQRNPGATEVVTRRAEILVDGEKWLRGRLDNIGNLLARGDTGNAKRDLEEIERKALLPAWEPLVAPVRERLAAVR